MSHPSNQAGFSIVELLITLTLAALVAVVFVTLFKTSLLRYLNIQQDASTATTIASQEARLANVLRGVTGVISADNTDLVAYAYFYPSDAYVSKIHYYLSNGALLADVTPMSSNPPIGRPLTGSMRNYTIIPNFYQAPGVSLFVYLDAGNGVLGTPVSDVTTIKSIQVNLAAKNSAGGNQSLQVQVMLRNEKTNL